MDETKHKQLVKDITKFSKQQLRRPHRKTGHLNKLAKTISMLLILGAIPQGINGPDRFSHW